MLGIITPATLTRYGRRFEERAMRYPRSWHICVVAEDRCRGEFFTAERRRQERFHTDHPGMSAYNADKPWESVMREASTNVDFWLRELQEPTLIYGRTRGDEHPSWTNQQHDGQSQQQGQKRNLGTQQQLPGGRGSNEICHNYNIGKCTNAECRRMHACETCGRQGHTKDQCWSKSWANIDGKSHGKGKRAEKKRRKGGK